MKLVDDSWTKKQLYAECKRRGIAGCSGLSKDGLIGTLNQGEATPTESISTKKGGRSKKQTVAELRAECRRRGLHNFSKLRKAGLISLLKEHPLDGKNVHYRTEGTTGGDRGEGEGGGEEKIEGGEREAGRGEGGGGGTRGGRRGGGRGGGGGEGGGRGGKGGKGGKGGGKITRGGGEGKSSRKIGPLRPRAQKRFDTGPTPLDTPGFLYIYSEPGGTVNEWKIGKTILDPPERRMLQSARNNKKVYVLKTSWYVAWCGFVEKIVHLDIDDLRVVPGKEKQGGGETEDGGTEWFRGDFDIIEARVRLVIRMVAAREADEADIAGVTSCCGFFRCGLPRRRQSAAK